MTDEIELPTDWPKCYACDKPATHAARDTIRGHDGLGHVATRPVGATIYGCDDHPVESTQHHTGMEIG